MVVSSHTNPLSSTYEKGVPGTVSDNLQSASESLGFARCVFIDKSRPNSERSPVSLEESPGFVSEETSLQDSSTVPTKSTRIYLWLSLCCRMRSAPALGKTHAVLHPSARRQLSEDLSFA